VQSVARVLDEHEYECARAEEGWHRDAGGRVQEAGVFEATRDPWAVRCDEGTKW
jgi:hypothetical protein